MRACQEVGDLLLFLFAEMPVFLLDDLAVQVVDFYKSPPADARVLKECFDLPAV